MEAEGCVCASVCVGEGACHAPSEKANGVYHPLHPSPPVPVDRGRGGVGGAVAAVTWVSSVLVQGEWVADVVTSWRLRCVVKAGCLCGRSAWLETDRFLLAGTGVHRFPPAVRWQGPDRTGPAAAQKPHPLGTHVCCLTRLDPVATQNPPPLRTHVPWQGLISLDPTAA